MKQKFLVFTLIVSVLAVLPGYYVFAQSTEQNQEDVTITGQPKEEEAASNFTPQLYSADSLLQTGTVVQVSPDSPSKVEPATQDKLSKAFGVVISANRLPLQIVNTTAEGQVYVATGGRHDALVTNENGGIEAGDLLVISSLSGTLAKSTKDQELVFAKALASFDGKNNSIGATTLQDSDGRPVQQVGIGRIPVAIQIMANPEVVSTKANLPEQLQRIGQAIAEKEVSPVRIYLSMAIVTLSIIIALAVLYVGIRSAIIAIGRNPLSKKSIFRGLLQVILSSILVLIIGLFTVYLLLRL